MDDFASALIDALGGTTKTAALMDAPLSTVHNMRTRKLTGSRLNHLRRIADDVEPRVNVEEIAERYGLTLEPITGADSDACIGHAGGDGRCDGVTSSGNPQEVSAEVAS